MQINTKFDIGEKVWYVCRNDGIMCSVVEEINIKTPAPYKRSKKSNRTLYGLHSGADIAEPHLYATREELVNSLLEGMI